MHTPDAQHCAAAELAAGAMRAPHDLAFKKFTAAWPLFERFILIRLRAAALPESLLHDCGQNIFVRLWTFRATYRGSSERQLWQWVRTICDNERRRILQRRAAERSNIARFTEQTRDPFADRGRVTDHGPRLEQAGAADDPPAHQAFRGDTLPALYGALARLKPVERRIIELIYLRPQLPERAVAALLDMSAATVHKVKTRALVRLRQILDSQGID